MRARLEKLTDEQWDLFDVPYLADNDGTAEVEVLGFAARGWEILVVWRDDHGYIHQLPAHVVRMLPNVTDGTDDKVFTNMPSAARRNASTIQRAVNAVAGPATVTPRGVR